MREFKFFAEKKNNTVYVPVITRDTNTTYHIPIDMYGHILEKGIELYDSDNVTELPTIVMNFTDVNEFNVGIPYQYKITSVTTASYDPVRIKIEYSIRFPDTEYYCHFKTTERIF